MIVAVLLAHWRQLLPSQVWVRVSAIRAAVRAAVPSMATRDGDRSISAAVESRPPLLLTRCRARHLRHGERRIERFAHL